MQHAGEDGKALMVMCLAGDELLQGGEERSRASEFREGATPVYTV